VIVSQGGAFGGWVLYVNDGRPKYCHNFLGLQRFAIEAERELPAGTHQVRMELDYAGGGLGQGGLVRLYLDGDQVGEGQITATVPLIFSGDETCDIGADTASPVGDEYTAAESIFSGAVNWVQIDVDASVAGSRSPDLAGGAPAHRDGVSIASDRPARGPPRDELARTARMLATPFPIDGPAGGWGWSSGRARDEQ
jgi:hypothetical protein